MKHTAIVTFIVLGIFFLSQVIGLGIINSYIDHSATEETGKLALKNYPLGLESPEIEGPEAVFSIIAAILIGTVLALVLIKFKQRLLWKLWFLVAIFVTLTIAFKPFIGGTAAIVLGGLLALWKIYRPNFIVHNFTELFVYGGLAVILLPLLNKIVWAALLLILISAYDIYAVNKSKHMIKLAKFQTKSKVFAGVLIPYKMPKLGVGKKGKKVKVRTAILGGGDIGFPLLFAGVIFKDLILTNSAGIAFAKTLVVPVFTTIALGWLLFSAEKDKFYPAMPTISAGAFLGFIAIKLLGFL